MDSQNTRMPDGVTDWTTAESYMFGDSQFNDAMLSGDALYGNTAFQDFTNMDIYGDSPGGLTMRAPSKIGADAAGANFHPHNNHHAAPAASAESSSLDSASDSSSRRKRKTESPVSDQTANADMLGRNQDIDDFANPGMGKLHPVRSLDHTYYQPANNVGLEQGLSRFAFASAASSPTHSRDPTSMNLDAKMRITNPSQTAQYNRTSPMDTINPGMFTINGRDTSPGVGNQAMYSRASPNAIFSTPSSDSPEALGGNQNWSVAVTRNQSWATDFTSQLTSPTNFTFDPSHAVARTSPAMAAKSPGGLSLSGPSPLHVAPISTKSRVETQINVVLTLEKPPPGIEHLHLPLHTIAKSKLLAKDEHDKSRVLELNTMLVCTSAMHNAEFREKALRAAAAQNNGEIQARAEQARETSDEDKNDPKSVPDDEKPANGGEVRICANCIQRERKRAGRKKTKREEEQQHWERFETERVVVFNSNEYLPFKPYDATSLAQREIPIGGEMDSYIPPAGAMQAVAAMRIACYCRHQNEKEGFQVIFTMKDQDGNVVAQQISDSILITDDHKTHPPAFPAAMANETFAQGANYVAHEMNFSHPSLTNIPSQANGFISSRSTGNLQGLHFDPRFDRQEMSDSNFTAQNTPSNMTPTSLSRPGSPTSAGQLGPNKKRKPSSSFHRKIPSGLMMTPRVDTSQPPSSNLPSAISTNSQFSPTSATFPTQLSHLHMSMPTNSASAQFLNSGPPTPNETTFFGYGLQTETSHNDPIFQSQPPSAQPSRASSPVLRQPRGNMAAYARQPIQTSTNGLGARPAFQTAPSFTSNETNIRQPPTITKCMPAQGPQRGGTEVAILGENFVSGMRVQFGGADASVQFLSANSLLVTTPSSSASGAVDISLHLPQTTTSQPPPPPATANYRYTDDSESAEMLIMAFKQLSNEQFGCVDRWVEMARFSANKFLQSQINPLGLPQGFIGAQRWPGGVPQQNGTSAMQTDWNVD